MRQTLLKLHSYAALLMLVPMFVIAVTGSLLVFKFELDTLLMPEQAVVDKVEGARQTLEHLISQINKRYENYEVGSWELFDDGTQADRVYLIKRGTAAWHKLYLNQYTGEFLGEPEPIHHYLTDWLVELHFTFLLNDLGAVKGQIGTIIGFAAAVVLTFLGISGLVIYRKFWRRFFKFRWDVKLKAMMSDFHKLVGIWSSPILLILGITGGYFNFVEYWHEAVEHADETPYFMEKRLYNDALNLDSILAISQEKINSFTPTYMLFPYEPEMKLTIFGSVNNTNPFASNYGSTVIFAPDSGSFIASYDIRDMAVSAQVIDSFRQLHFGNFAGLTSKIIWCILGFSPVILAGTGFYLWYTRSFAKRRKRRQGVASSSA